MHQSVNLSIKHKQARQTLRITKQNVLSFASLQGNTYEILFIYEQQNTNIKLRAIFFLINTK